MFFFEGAGVRLGQNQNQEMSNMAAGCRPPFTASQWEELERQALIFKYMMTGVPVPSELLLPMRRTLQSVPSRFYHHPALGYCTYYGKKLDPEPGRCRRTDGKKWRCSKDAHPDSKYCERHMHRSRSRSRKPVESQPLSQSQSSSSSTVTSLARTGSACGGRSIPGSFQSVPMQQQSGAGGSSLQSTTCLGAASTSQLNMDLGSYGMGNKEYRFPYGAKSTTDEHSFFSEASGSARGLGVDSSLDSSWRLMTSRASSPLSKVRSSYVPESIYPQLHSVQDLEQAAISSLSKPQQQYSFFGCDFGSPGSGKLESQSLHPFLDEWPRTKNSWSDLEDERSNRASFSNTQLAISIPMASSDFSTTTSRSPNDD